MIVITAIHDKKKYIMTINGTVLTLKMKGIFFTKNVGVFSLEEFASNAVFNDETAEVRYKDFLFRIVDRHMYDLLKSTVDEILKNREKEEKIKKEIKLINSAIKPSLFEILKSRLWYSMYLNYANEAIYVDAVYNLPYEVVKVKDPLEAYEFLKKSIYENVTKFTRFLESISQENREKILDILKEAISKQDSLLDSHDYGKISDIMDDIKSFVDDSINRLVEQISVHSGFSRKRRQKSIEPYSEGPVEKT